MSSSKHIDDLSEELLLEIFSYLSFSDLVFSVQFVCRKWKRVSYDNELWRDKVYRPDCYESDAFVERTLKLTPKLNALILDRTSYSPAVLKTLIRTCHELRRLEFYEYEILSCEFLKELVDQCPKIEYLKIPLICLENIESSKKLGSLQNLKILKIGGAVSNLAPQLRPLADGCPSLESVDLTGIWYCRVEDLKYFLHKKKEKLHTIGIKWSYDDVCILQFLTDCTVLRSLSIENYNIRGSDVKEAFKTIKMLKIVTSLSLLDLDEADIENVIGIFNYQNMSQLVELTITQYEEYRNALARTIVKNCPNLRKLFINECNSLSDKSVEDYDKLENLQCVELKSSAITDKSVTCLTKCKKLRHLSLENCFLLSEEGMSLITSMRNLQFLNLDSCNVRGLHWCLIPFHLQQLKFLSINYCENVDEIEVFKLKLEMPHLTVENAKSE